MTPDLDTLLDRLVDGDLAPAELREALAVVEAAPDGWRRCTLAFLEARCLDLAFREPPPAPAVSVAAPPRRLHRPALAAAVALVCFGSGWLVGGRSVPVDEPGPPMPRITQAEPSPEVPEVRPEPAAPERVPVPSWVVNQPMPVSEAGRAELEARGYRLEQQRRLVGARLADGRRVVVPVDRLGLRYVGGATL